MSTIYPHTSSRHRPLPQTTGDGFFVTDGGLETELVFHDGIDLPCFAAFPLLDDPDQRARLRGYYDGYLGIARKFNAGFIIETPTWRANPDWASAVGYSPEQLDAANRSAVALAEEVRAAATAEGITAVVSGCVGPRGDGYDPGNVMTPGEAERYHAVQIGTFASTTADQVTAITMTNAEEAIGIVHAAAAAGIPSAISFTVETDGRLPTGQPLREAIEQVDDATNAGAAYFMVNCAHPTHWALALQDDGAWRDRLIGLRSNSSAKSHAELDEATELDEGDPIELGAQHVAQRDRLPAVRVLGGCCGTDARHVAAIVSAWRTN
ncbi:homocysteine S-methyltransferase [Mycolicibacterium agri]|uniref:Homocysteine S-methyltransferase n=1 Tax=Mycolicibacterium agri TaxID=36811 RepID=A0A2A7MYD9_MYCAG|nr:homocysteine S-methyltransferase family protein [Mycolicibacterium agri]PEG36812.1 homocysteine S-methyltransferase [Mycolicibacterium agri]GFG50703.1 homocysteine S-methyltransferase [Mycolicibacterium agri]